MKKVLLNEVQNEFPWQARLPEWLKYYDVLIRTRRRNKYYITKALAMGQTWHIRGLQKFKVIGWKEPLQND